MENLNPYLPAEAFDLAIEELTRDRSRISVAAANRESYQLIKNGVKVKIPDAYGNEDTIEIVKVIEWNGPINNDYFLASQFWIAGEMYTRRPSVAIRKGSLGLAKERGSRHYGKGLSEAYDLRKGDDRRSIR